MATPAQRFVEFLILAGEDTGTVVERLRGQGLDQLEPGDVDRVRQRLDPPTPFNPWDRCSVHTQQYLAGLGVRGCFHPGPEQRCAAELLEKPRAREMLEAALISGGSERWTSALLRNRDIMLNPRSVAAYRRTYFDVDAATLPELRRAVSARVPVSERGDLRVLALGTRGSPLAQMMLLLRLGSLPSNVELTKLVKATQCAATASTLEATLAGRPRRARSLAAVAATMTSIIESVGDPEGEFAEELNRLVVVTNEHVPPLVHELGAHTTDVMPHEESRGEQVHGSPGATPP